MSAVDRTGRRPRNADEAGLVELDSRSPVDDVATRGDSDAWDRDLDRDDDVARPMPDAPVPGENPNGMQSDMSTMDRASTELWPQADAQGLRDRWREVQLRFVDDPHAAANDAASIVDDASRTLTTAIESHVAELGQWRGARPETPVDTEQLRVVVQRYRAFLDQVLGV